MTEEPAPAGESTAVVLARDPKADLDAERRGERFLKRVAGLSAEEWGRLDAAAQRLFARDPLSRWESARYLASFTAMVPAFEAAFTAFGIVSGLVADARRWLRGGPGRFDHRPSYEAAVRHEELADSALVRQLRALGGIRERGSHVSGAAWFVLDFSLVALHLHRGLAPDAFARLYAPGEPVIPFASL